MTRTKAHRKRQRMARNFGAEAPAIRERPCIVNLSRRRVVDSLCRGAVQAAHVVARGMGGAHGGRFDLVPMCALHHGQQSTKGIKSFADLYHLDLRAIADQYALEHEPPLGIRGLAQRWVVVHEQGSLEEKPPITGYELAALMGWTRRRMEAYTVECLDDGWTWNASKKSDREAMAGWIAVDLEIGDEESFAAALEICEAGWPS
jgi:hypothetical protein